MISRRGITPLRAGAMKGRPPRRGAVASLAALSVLILFGVSDLAGAAARDSGPAAARERVHAALAALCRDGDRSDTGGGTPDDTGDAGAPDDAGEAGAGTLSPGGAVELSREPLRARGGHPVGVRRSLMLPDGARLWIDRIEPGGTLRRVVVRYAEPDRSGARPVLLAVAGGDCRITAGRRLTYYEDGMARAVEHLGSDLERVTRTEPLNPPVPGGVERGVVRVALVDSGVNYLLPEIRSRLARGEDGGLVGFDFWDLDARPFDAHPARSAFHPRRHGTRTASLLLAEAPVAALVPYRYPRNDMSRMRRLVEDAAAAGVRIVNLSMGSRRLAEWSDFEAAARDHPEMLFVVSAGNEGLDIDETPVYPASLTLDNLLAVTSADDSGRPARGSNRGRESVDVAVPAERVPVTGFDGRLRRASGSSYAAARVSALAACLLAAHPEWSAAALKSAILARAGKAALPAPDYTGAGLIRDPAGAGRGACPARPDTLSAIPLDSWTPETPRPEGRGTRAFPRPRPRRRDPGRRGMGGPGGPPRARPRRGNPRPMRGRGGAGAAADGGGPAPLPPSRRRLERAARGAARPRASRGVLRRRHPARAHLRGRGLRPEQHPAPARDARQRLDHPGGGAPRRGARARALPRPRGPRAA